MQDIYLTAEQIDELHRLAHNGGRFGAPLIGVQVTGDDLARSTVRLVACMGDLDNALTIIEPDGASPGWER